MNTKQSYALTEKQVEQLAHSHVVADGEISRTNNTYLRVLLTAMQSQLGKGKKKLPVEDVSSVLDSVHAKYYAAVLRGVTTPDIAPDDTLPSDEQSARSREVRRRGTFARSAKSTIAVYVAAGGDVRTLDVHTTTKAGLRQAVQPTRSERDERAVQRAVARLTAIFGHRARDNPDAAREALQSVMDDLQAVLDSLGEEPAEHVETQETIAGARVPTFSSSRVMQAPPQLHRGA